MIVGGVLHVFGGVGSAEAQRPSRQLSAVGNDLVRVIFPSRLPVDTARANLLIETLGNQYQPPGLPAGILTGKRVTISLAMQLPQGTNGRADPVQRLIILPYTDVFRWAPLKLRRVMRHELAHIALARFLDYPPRLPSWFAEGFADWSAGGLTCEGETRIWFELTMRERRGAPWPGLVPVPGLQQSRLSYDLWTSFFEYIDDEWDGVVTDGILLEAIKSHGIHGGMARVLGTNLRRLEEGWQRYLLRRYLDRGLRSC